MLFTFAILPEGAVREETTFLLLLAGIAILVTVALYLRTKGKREGENP